jgi:hypothetical protein
MKIAKVVAALIVMISIVAGVSVSGASDYGCRVLLCMSNPAGPKAVSECVPTINRLLSDMAKGGFHWPPCEEAESGGSRAVQTNERHEPCPNGYVELPGGAIALTDADYQKAINPATWVNHDETKYLKWTYPIYSSMDENGYGMRNDYVLCGKGGSKNIDIAKTYERRDGGVTYKTYENAIVYDKIALAKTIHAENVIDVYIDGKLYKRVPLNY